MTKYVISGYIGFDNFGDEAIAGVLINHLKSINAEKITVLSANPIKTSNIYGVDSAPFLNFYKPIFTSDVLISGGGSLLQDVTSLKSLIYYLTVIVTALVLNKKVIIFAQGFTPFRTKIGEWLTKFVLKRCDFISVRDKTSQDFLEKLGIHSELLSDPIFGLGDIKTNVHKGIGVQLRSFPTLTEEFMETLAEEIALRFPKEEIKLFSLQDNIDLPVIEKFVFMLSKRNIISKIHKNMGIQETIAELSKLEYLIGMRFHSNLVAAKTGVKVLGINYDIKVETLAKTINFPVISLIPAEIKNGVDKLMSLNADEYNMPEFHFPNFNY